MTDAIAIDTETWLVDKVFDPIPPMVSMVFDDGERTQLIHHSDPAARRLFIWCLENAVTTGANYAYDLCVAIEKWPDLLPLVFDALENDGCRDVLINQAIIEIAHGKHRKLGGYNLGEVCRRISGVVLDKTDPWRMRYKELHDVQIHDWPDDAVRYAKRDGWGTRLADEDQQREYGDLLEWQYHRMRLAFAVYLQRTRGVRIDADAVEELDTRLENRYISIREELKSVGFLWGNGKSGRPVKRTNTKNTKAIKQAIADAVPWDRIKLTPKAVEQVESGEIDRIDAIEKLCVSTDHESTLMYASAIRERANDERRAGRDSCELDELASAVDRLYEYKNIELMRSRVIRGFQVPVVRTHYEPIVASGRVSSSEPQMHNLPRKGGYRECIVARDGYIFVITDLNSIELVCISQVCINLFGGSVMGEVINAGRSPHTMIAAQLLGVDYETAEAGYKAGDPEVLNARQAAKPANFGFLVGMSANRFQSYAKRDYGLELELYECENLRETFYSTWPYKSRYIKWCKRQMGGFGKRATAIQPYSGRVRGGCTFTEFANTHFQGYAADGFGLIQWELCKSAYLDGYDDEFFGAFPVMNIHDENVTEAPIERADEVMAAQERIFVDAFQPIVPDVCVRVESKKSPMYVKG